MAPSTSWWRPTASPTSGGSGSTSPARTTSRARTSWSGPTTASIRGVDDLGRKAGLHGPGIDVVQEPRRPPAGRRSPSSGTLTPSAPTRLSTGVVDAVTTDQAILSGYNLQSGGAFKLLNASFGRDEHYGIGLPKDEPGLPHLPQPAAEGRRRQRRLEPGGQVLAVEPGALPSRDRRSVEPCQRDRRRRRLVGWKASRERRGVHDGKNNLGGADVASVGLAVAASMSLASCGHDEPAIPAGANFTKDQVSRFVIAKGDFPSGYEKVDAETGSVPCDSGWLANHGATAETAKEAALEAAASRPRAPGVPPVGLREDGARRRPSGRRDRLPGHRRLCSQTRNRPPSRSRCSGSRCRIPTLTESYEGDAVGLAQDVATRGLGDESTPGITRRADARARFQCHHGRLRLAGAERGDQAVRRLRRRREPEATSSRLRRELSVRVVG